MFDVGQKVDEIKDETADAAKDGWKRLGTIPRRHPNKVLTGATVFFKPSE